MSAGLLHPRLEPGGPFYGPTGMIWYRLVALGLLTAAVSACAGGSSTTPSGLVRTRGVIVRVGGPSPGSPEPIAAAFRVAATNGSASGRADRHGRFTLLLKPGTYRVTITGHGPESDGRPMQPVPDVIHVEPPGTRIRLVVSIR
jgi:hypothetical protein